MQNIEEESAINNKVDSLNTNQQNDLTENMFALILSIYKVSKSWVSKTSRSCNDYNGHAYQCAFRWMETPGQVIQGFGYIIHQVQPGKLPE